VEYHTEIEHFRDAALVVIPARNEAATVGEVIDRVQRLGFDVVVVDDGSEDDTAAAARAAGAVVLELPFNTGAWIAMQTGIRFGIRRDYQFVVTLDADGQHDPGAIPTMWEAYRSECEPNVIVGSCVSRGSRARKLTWWFFRNLAGLHVKDLTSGYRIYDRTAMELVAEKAATLLEYQDVGVLILLKRGGMKLCEVNIEMRARATGKSRIFHSWLKVVYYLACSFLLLASKIPRPRPIDRRSAVKYP
jgi:glycosyltransferase involved in cell wall biosynthesis